MIHAFREGSSYELNLTASQRQEVEMGILRGATQNIFNNAQQAIYRLMEMDSVPKYVRSNIYRSIKGALYSFMQVTQYTNQNIE